MAGKAFKIKKEETEGEAPAEAPAPSISLNDLASKLDQVISLLTQAATPAVGGEILASKQEGEGTKEGAPEGTMDAGSGEGEKKKLPEEIAEKTHEDMPGKQAEGSEVEKNVELQTLKKDVKEMKEIMKSVKIEKSTTARPGTNLPTPGIKKESTTELALEIAKGNRPDLTFADLDANQYVEVKKQVLEAIGRTL